MCEASKEYKQVFDQKARSMTEKYAKPNASPNHGGHQFVLDAVMTEDKAPEPVKSDVHEYSAGFKKLLGIGRKLSLGASGSNTKVSDVLMNDPGSNEILEHGRRQFITYSSITEDKVSDSTKKTDVADQKAISTTLKCAKPDASPDHGGIQFLADSIMTEDKPVELVKTDLHEYAVGLKKLLKKLSPNAAGSNTRESGIGINEAPLNTVSSQPKMQEPKTDLKGTAFLHQQFDQDKKVPAAFSSKKQSLSVKNLQHEVFESTKRTNDTMPPGPQKELISDVKAHNNQEVQKLTGISRMLSLNALGSNTRESEMGMNEAPLNTIGSKSQIQEPKDLKGTTLLHQQLDHDKKAPSCFFNEVSSS